MKRFGIISYNIHCNFTNYGSALQSWALQQAADRLGAGRWETVLVDYCPAVLQDKNPRDPIAHMWDTDPQIREMCRRSLPAIQKNADQFDRFYTQRFRRTQGAYTPANFEQMVDRERLDGFVCGSDTIFCIDEFGGFEDGYYANYPCMKQGYSVAYAASFGDAHFTADSEAVLKSRLQNFKGIGLREGGMLPFARRCVDVPVQRVLDPTLLLTAEDYAPLLAAPLMDRPYLLLYARRHDPAMTAFARRLAAQNGWAVAEISLWAANAQKGHRMLYEAGVEEFLALVQNAEYVVTNSYHGMIFSIQYQKDFYVFSRQQCSSKITELLALLGLSGRLLHTGREPAGASVDYARTAAVLRAERERSLQFLRQLLAGLPDQTGTKGGMAGC